MCPDSLYDLFSKLYARRKVRLCLAVVPIGDNRL